jgi:hypothetical protein
LNSGARISVYRQWIGKLKQLIGMIREAYYDHVTTIRLYSAERAGDGGGQRLFVTPISQTVRSKAALLLKTQGRTSHQLDALAGCPSIHPSIQGRMNKLDASNNDLNSFKIIRMILDSTVRVPKRLTAPERFGVSQKSLEQEPHGKMRTVHLLELKRASQRPKRDPFQLRQAVLLFLLSDVAFRCIFLVLRPSSFPPAPRSPCPSNSLGTCISLSR